MWKEEGSHLFFNLGAFSGNFYASSSFIRASSGSFARLITFCSYSTTAFRIIDFRENVLKQSNVNVKPVPGFILFNLISYLNLICSSVRFAYLYIWHIGSCLWFDNFLFKSYLFEYKMRISVYTMHRFVFMNHKHESASHRHASMNHRCVSTNNKHASTDYRHASMNHKHTSTNHRHAFMNYKHASTNYKHVSMDHKHVFTKYRHVSSDCGFEYIYVIKWFSF
jgi:hypothetical protein